MPIEYGCFKAFRNTPNVTNFEFIKIFGTFRRVFQLEASREPETTFLQAGLNNQVISN